MTDDQVLSAWAGDDAFIAFLAGCDYAQSWGEWSAASLIDAHEAYAHWCDQGKTSDGSGVLRLLTTPLPGSTVALVRELRGQLRTWGSGLPEGPALHAVDSARREVLDVLKRYDGEPAARHVEQVSDRSEVAEERVPPPEPQPGLLFLQDARSAVEEGHPPPHFEWFGREAHGGAVGGQENR